MSMEKVESRHSKTRVDLKGSLVEGFNGGRKSLNTQVNYSS